MIVDPAQVPYPRLTILTACAKDEISSSYPQAEHGLFTYYLLKSWSAAGDANGDGKITIAEMSHYVTSNVAEKAGDLDRKQTPTHSCAENQDEVIVEYK